MIILAFDRREVDGQLQRLKSYEHRQAKDCILANSFFNIQADKEHT